MKTQNQMSKQMKREQSNRQRFNRLAYEQGIPIEDAREISGVEPKPELAGGLELLKQGAAMGNKLRGHSPVVFCLADQNTPDDFTKLEAFSGTRTPQLQVAMNWIDPTRVINNPRIFGCPLVVKVTD